ncbi:hypothetical protein DPMN_171301 [Dreissena polymorpha]|uniref:Uncharacterized protein n=1 Tax=Dreissena polymorpha TaxID=45954 RepID=A0A9D4DXR1_DREPO|nr:hypothetical protein DPMN_171301 [Dreissena polymorpha]
MEVSEGLYLLNSKLGWILSGRTKSASESDEEENLLILTFGSQLYNTSVLQTVDSVVQTKVDLEDFWNLESIGVKNENEEVLDDEIVMKKFKDKVIFEDGRYQVTWP